VKVEVHKAFVHDDVHRTPSGQVVADAKIAVRCPAVAGSEILRWVAPMYGSFWVVPVVGAPILLWKLGAAEYRWSPTMIDDALPSWFAADPTDFAGIQSRDGAYQAAFDSDGLHLGLATAVRRVALWDDDGALHGLKETLLDIIQAIYDNASHKHPAGTILDSMGGVCTGDSGQASGWSRPYDAKNWTDDDEPAAGKVFGV